MVVGWFGGAGEDELARSASPIDFMSHMIPDSWCELPFVYQPWGFTGQHCPDIQIDHLFRVFVTVESHLACRRAQCGFGLPAGFRAFN
ncbi:MAG: hypothetical protein OXH27_01125, partial [Gammaproteobacteria bacterium]|nr:hypothetical protein [Gammaproteobacteria bacterium]